jgi:signal transduction histidine kinase
MEADLDARPSERGVVERGLVRLQVPDHVARLLASTPSLRLSWVAAASFAVGFSAWAANAGTDGHLVFLVVAPVLPVVGVAAAYGPWADPAHELTAAAPFSGIRLLLLRAVAVLVATTLVTAVAGALVPAGELSSFAWVLPALALTVASLALFTLVAPHVAAAAVTGAWVAIVAAAELRSAEPLAAFRGQAQVTFSLVVIAAAATVAWRRDRLDRRGRAGAKRLVDVADTERRRIERDIHDGAQQQLVAISVKVGLARALVDRDPERARVALDEIRADVQGAIDALRELTRGSYPPILADDGLAAALMHKAERAPVPIVVAADGIGRLPRDVETAVYFCCLEAIQNASKYAEASKIVLSLRCAGGHLAFDVIDDGRGFDPTVVRRGVGLRSLEERLAVLGGTLEVRSAPGRGTTIAGRVPLASRDDQPPSES